MIQQEGKRQKETDKQTKKRNHDYLGQGACIQETEGGEEVGREGGLGVEWYNLKRRPSYKPSTSLCAGWREDCGRVTCTTRGGSVSIASSILTWPNGSSSTRNSQTALICCVSKQRTSPPRASARCRQLGQDSAAESSPISESETSLALVLGGTTMPHDNTANSRCWPELANLPRVGARWAAHACARSDSEEPSLRRMAASSGSLRRPKVARIRSRNWVSLSTSESVLSSVTRSNSARSANASVSLSKMAPSFVPGCRGQLHGSGLGEAERTRLAAGRDSASDASVAEVGCVPISDSRGAGAAPPCDDSCDCCEGPDDAPSSSASANADLRRRLLVRCER
eukprot:m.33108 g.33108  ORF g.33108 m.33108 type:complete len:340 (+) comp5594_c0_seq1:585-1604(+)